MFRLNFSLWRRLNGGGLCIDFLGAQYNSAISADRLSYKDKYGEDRKYHKAGSIKPDTTVFFSGDVQSTDTIACSGTAVPEVDDGYFYFSTAGSAWDIKITRLGSVIAWYPCVTGDGTVLANVLSDDGSGGVTAENAPADLWQEHTDGNGSNYINEFGFTEDGTKKQPASQADADKDWLGNQLQHKGPAGTPLEIVKAPVLIGDGVAYGTFATAITLSGDFKVSGTFRYIGTSGEQTLIGGAATVDGIIGYIPDNTHNKFQVYIGGVLTELATLVENTLYVFELIRIGTTLSLDLNGDITSGACSGANLILVSIAARSGSNSQSTCEFHQIEVGSSVYSMTEGTPADPSDIIYDRSGNGNHLTLLNSDADNWALKERESYPLVDGFTFNGTNRIPSLLSDKTKDATGAAIQYTDKQSMNADSPVVVSLAPSQPVIESENTSGNRLFTDGSGNMEELTFSDFSANFHDTVFYKSPNKLAVYTEPITGDCLAKTKKYFGLTEYLLGDGTDYLVDNAGANLVTGG